MSHRPIPPLIFGRLKTAEDIAAKHPASAERLTELADAGYAPHFRIEGGPPLFMLGEIGRWLQDNLLERIEGARVPWEIHVWSGRQLLASAVNAPPPPLVLSEVPNLLFGGPVHAFSGVYFLCRGDNVVYVGQSVTLSARIGIHSSEKQMRPKEFDRAYLLPVPREHLNRVEAAFIRALRPEYNGLPPRSDVRDDEEILQQHRLRKP